MAKTRSLTDLSADYSDLRLLSDNSRSALPSILLILQDNNSMHHLIYCTCPDRETAEGIAKRLVADKLAACVNILPGLISVYEWQAQIETAQEHLLLIKSPLARYDAIEAAIKTLHPYQLPEIIAVAIERGSAEYLKWIDACLPTN